MKIQAFRTEVTKHLREFDMFSENAVELLTMICAHESHGGRYMRQVGGGPARGFFQIELPTHDSVWANHDKIKQRARAYNIVQDAKLLETDLRYNVFVARHYLAMDTAPLPKGYIEMAMYAKSYWNRGGKATAEEYMKDLLLWERGLLG